jgi:hypothetical protein
MKKKEKEEEEEKDRAHISRSPRKERIQRGVYDTMQ